MFASHHGMKEILQSSPPLKLEIKRDCVLSTTRAGDSKYSKEFDMITSFKQHYSLANLSLHIGACKKWHRKLEKEIS